MQLVTTWYGSFVMDDEGQVLASALFPKSAEEIASLRERGVLG